MWGGRRGGEQAGHSRPTCCPFIPPHHLTAAGGPRGPQRSRSGAPRAVLPRAPGECREAGRGVRGRLAHSLPPLISPPSPPSPPQSDEERDRAAAGAAAAAATPALAAAAADKERRYRETLGAIATERDRSEEARGRAEDTAADLSERLAEKEGRAADAHAAFAELKHVTATGAGERGGRGNQGAGAPHSLPPTQSTRTRACASRRPCWSATRRRRRPRSARSATSC